MITRTRLSARPCRSLLRLRGAVLHNASSAELWRRTTIYITRQLAVSLGLSRAECAKALRLEHAKVAEFQRRGLCTFTPWSGRTDLTGRRLRSTDTLVTACLPACVRWRSPMPEVVPVGGVRSTSLCSRRDERSTRVATYVAKYATKEPAMHPGLLGRILSDADLKRRGLPPHLYNMVATAWSLGAVPELVSLGLRRHAHHLGYSGHFLTKSRRYSTTFGALRGARAAVAPTKRSTVPTESRPRRSGLKRWDEDGPTAERRSLPQPKLVNVPRTRRRRTSYGIPDRD